jgi:large subunit ribosomal protein L10
MGMTREAKAEALEGIRQKMTKARAGLVTGYTGLDVAALNEIRTAFRQANVEYKVIKNTLFRRVLDEGALSALKGAFVGPTAVAFKYDDEIGALGKVAKELAKKFEKLEFRAGFIDEEVLEGGERSVETIASLPTLDEARAQLLGLLNTPAARLLAQLNAPASNLIGVIQAKADKEKESA